MITGTPLGRCFPRWEEVVDSRQVPSEDHSSPSAGPNLTIHLPRRKAES